MDIVEMKKGLYVLVVAFVTGVSLLSCKPQVPGEYLQPDEMEDILFDYHIAAGMIDEDNGSAAEKNACQASVLKEHGVTQAMFDSSLVYYSRHCDRFQKIYENLSRRLGEEAVSLGASASDIGNFGDGMQRGDTANVWKESPACVLTTLSPNNVKSFCLEADTAFHKGDRIVLSMKTQFIFQDGRKDAVAMLAVRFSNDSVATRTVHIYESSNYDLTITDDARLGIKEISGFIILLDSPGSSATTLKLMFVEGIRLVRCHLDSTKADETDKSATDSLDSQPSTSSPVNEPRPQPVGAPITNDDKPMVMPERKLSDRAR